MNVIRAELTTDFTRPASTCINPQGSGEVTFVLITAGEKQAATLMFINGPTSDYPQLGIPLRVPAGNSQAFDFPNGSIEFSNGLFGTLSGEGAQARIKVLLEV
jgi:hypothetical protein